MRRSTLSGIELVLFNVHTVGGRFYTCSSDIPRPSRCWRRRGTRSKRLEIASARPSMSKQSKRSEMPGRYSKRLDGGPQCSRVMRELPAWKGRKGRNEILPNDTHPSFHDEFSRFGESGRLWYKQSSKPYSNELVYPCATTYLMSASVKDEAYTGMASWTTGRLCA